MKICISEREFKERAAKLNAKMHEMDLDAIIVYGDEYRKENLRYVSNFWPIFERGAMLMQRDGEPMTLCAPEGEQVAKEMSVWKDVRLVPDFLCVGLQLLLELPLLPHCLSVSLSSSSLFSCVFPSSWF